MSRKFLILNFVLVVIAVYAVVQLRKQWQSAKAREAAVLHVPPRTLPPPKYDKLPADAPIMPSSYADVAQKFLFDRSRNPTVIVEAPPAPPPKPMPPLPVYHGLMNLGGGTMAVLSVSKDAAHQTIRPGEAIGQFKLLDVNSEEMSLEWDGKTIHKKVDELTAPAAPVEPAAARVEAVSAPTPPPPPAKSGPGELTPQGGRICAMNDGNAEGAIVEGHKKVVYTTPFGQSCLWQPVSK